MEVSGQFHALAALPLEKGLPVSFGQETEWDIVGLVAAE
jgi:hypothetical protein